MLITTLAIADGPCDNRGPTARTLCHVAHTDLRDDDPVRIGGALIVGRLGAGGMGWCTWGATPTGARSR